MKNGSLEAVAHTFIRSIPEAEAGLLVYKASSMTVKAIHTKQTNKTSCPEKPKWENGERITKFQQK